MFSKLFYSLQLRLIAAFMLISLLFALVSGGIVFYHSYHESLEFQDDLLKQAAAYNAGSNSADAAADIDDDLMIHIDTPRAPHPNALAVSHLDAGFHDIEADGERYRAYIQNGDSGRVTV